MQRVAAHRLRRSTSRCRHARHEARDPGHNDRSVIEITLPHALVDLRQARRSLAAELRAHGFEREHLDDVVSVVNELVTAAHECQVSRPLELTVVEYPQVTTVRLRCDHKVELRDKPFQLRERMLSRLTLECGRRARPDGDVDLWAEVIRRPPADHDARRAVHS